MDNEPDALNAEPLAEPGAPETSDGLARRVSVVFEDAAKDEIKDGAAWLAGFAGVEAGKRFLRAVAAGVSDLANEIDARLVEDAPAGLRPAYSGLFVKGWPVQILTVYTAKKRARRSASGTWRVYYILPDENGDGRPDVVKVVSVRHAAALPYGATREDDE